MRPQHSSPVCPRASVLPGIETQQDWFVAPRSGADCESNASPRFAPTPTVDDARAHGSMAVSADNTFFCNYYGLPAISVPSGVDKNGLPVGLQIVGPQGGDGLVLALAHAYQRASGWCYAPPQGAKVRLA